MDEKLKTIYQAKARIFKALAHPTRLFILDELAKNERCVQDLTRMIEVDISTISRHLFILKSCGLIKDEKRGNFVYYQVKMPCIFNFFNCIDQVMKASLEEQIDITKCSI